MTKGLTKTVCFKNLLVDGKCLVQKLQKCNGFLLKTSKIIINHCQQKTYEKLQNCNQKYKNVICLLLKIVSKAYGFC